MVTISKNCIAYLNFPKSVDLDLVFPPYTHRHTHTHTHKGNGNCEVIDMLISLIVVIISQCMYISHHQLYTLNRSNFTCQLYLNF